MNKEELIKLIESLEIEEISQLIIGYYSEKENSYSMKIRDLKTISYNLGINRELERIDNRINELYRFTTREIEECVKKEVLETNIKLGKLKE